MLNLSCQLLQKSRAWDAWESRKAILRCFGSDTTLGTTCVIWTERRMAWIGPRHGSGISKIARHFLSFTADKNLRNSRDQGSEIQSATSLRHALHSPLHQAGKELINLLWHIHCPGHDIDLLLACSLVSVALVLATQLISDVGYAYLNPRIRVH